MTATILDLNVYRAHRRVQRVLADHLSDRSALRVLGGLNSSLAASLLSEVLQGAATLDQAGGAAREWLAEW
jgi:hypothetical protein